MEHTKLYYIAEFINGVYEGVVEGPFGTMYDAGLNLALKWDDCSGTHKIISVFTEFQIED